MYLGALVTYPGGRGGGGRGGRGGLVTPLSVSRPKCVPVEERGARGGEGACCVPPPCASG